MYTHTLLVCRCCSSLESGYTFETENQIDCYQRLMATAVLFHALALPRGNVVVESSDQFLASGHAAPVNHWRGITNSPNLPRPDMAWALLPNARPPYNQSVFRNHAVVCREEKSGRVESVGGARGGTCAADTSWRYTWREKGETAQPALTGKELCQLLPDGAQVLSMGDSISEQLLSSWRARLFTSGIDHPQRAMGRNTVCKDAPLTRFYHVEVWAWVLEGSAQFESSDSRTEDCAAELRRQPSAFGLKVVSRAALREIVGNATEVDLTLTPTQP